MVRNGKYGSSYGCNEKGCDPWVFALPQCALSSTMRASLTSFTPFSECFITLHLPPSLTPHLLLRRDIQTDIRKKYLAKKVFVDH